MGEIAIEWKMKNLLNIVWGAFANQKFVESSINCFEDLPPEDQSYLIEYFSQHLPRLRWQGSGSFAEGYQKLTPPRQKELMSYLTPYIFEQIQEALIANLVNYRNIARFSSIVNHLLDFREFR
ncbi:hypothetical protein HYU13_05480 [Candidatus Woesearchaeota archaeon]|nr:hypothetical protein [Candidatus Woesearchaeota archaeon]